MASSSGDDGEAERAAFQDHYADLFEAIQNPTTLAVRLFSAGLLSGEKRKKICSGSSADCDKAVTELLDAVETTIRGDPNNFYKFLKELEKDSPMKPLCETLRSKCGTQEKSAGDPSATLGKHHDKASLGIDDLVEVMNALEKVNGWQSLGLQLGLLYTTLEAIEDNNRGQVEQCKRKMISAWLKRQKNVLQVGAPSWSVLKAALKKIGENAVAEEIVTCS